MNIQKLIIIFSLSISCLNAGPKKISLESPIIHNLCCFLFGKETPSENVQTYFDNKTQHFPALTNKKIPIKYIKPNALLNQYTSFTWFGTWINKDLWESASSEQKEWLTLHELAHTACYHPIKQILAFLGTTTFALHTSKTFKWKKIPTALTTITLTTLVSSALSRMYEKEADIEAAKILQKQNKENVIQSHIYDLDKEPNTFNPWFYSPRTQIQYLAQFLSVKPITQTN